MRKKELKPKLNGVSLNVKEESALAGAKKIKIPFWGEIMQTLLVIAAALGALFTFSTILDLSVEKGIVAIFTVLFALAYTLIFKTVKKRYSVLLGTVAALILVFLIAYSDVTEGALILLEQGKSAISDSMYWDEVVFSFEWEDSMYASTNLVLCMISLLLTCLINYFITVKPNFLAVFLLTFPFFEIGAAFGCVPDYLWFSLMIGSWAAALTLHQASRVSKKKNTANNKNTALRAKMFAGSAVVIAALTVGLFFGGRALLSAIGFDRTENIEKLRTEVKTQADDTIDYVLGRDNDGSLKEGKLLEVDDHKVMDRHYFTMETSLQSISQNLYVKGYSATKYTGTEWKQTDSYDEYEKMFSEFSTYGYRMGGVNGSLLESHNDYQSFEQARLKFSDFRRVKNYTYAVGSPVYDETYSAVYDYTLASDKKTKYEYDTYLNLEDIFKIKESERYKSKLYQELWKEYCEFVKKEYTAEVDSEEVKELLEWFDTSDKYLLIDQIRYYFKENIKHTYIVSKSPKDVDFVENFLFNTKSGYSTHFATAATVILQAAGYPARYVEGYCLRPQEFNKIETDNKYGYITVDMTDRYAHAWVEIFDATYGWIPVDVTDGYYSGSFYEFMKPYLGMDEEDEFIEEEETEEESETELREEIIEIEIEEDPELLKKQKLEEERRRREAKIRLIIILVSTFVGLIAAAIIALISASFAVRAKRRRQMDSDNTDISVAASYKYFCALSSYEGIPQNFKTYGEYIDICAEMSPHLDKDELYNIFSVMLKSGFSNEPISREEASVVADFVRTYSVKIYGSLKFFKRLKFRFLKHLI